jgi:hypothetical protein
LLAILDTGQPRGQLAVGSLPGSSVERADGATDSGVHLVSDREGDLQEIRQVVGVKVLGDGAAQAASELLRGRVKDFGSCDTAVRMFGA